MGKRGRKPGQPVICSYCYTQGHNKRTCPTLKAHEPEHFEYNKKWNKENREYRNKRRREVYGKTQRKCSYCNGKGHNKRSCAELNADRMLFEDKNHLFRRKALKIMEDLGLGLGALYEYRGCAYMVDRINWDAITFCIGEQASDDYTDELGRPKRYPRAPHNWTELKGKAVFHAKRVSGCPDGRYRPSEIDIKLPRNVEDLGMLHVLRNKAPLGPLARRCPKAHQEWLHGESGISVLFEKQK